MRQIFSRILLAAFALGLLPDLEGAEPPEAPASAPGGGTERVPPESTQNESTQDGPATVPADQVGVAEKLGSLVALDAALRDEEGGTVTLRDVIGKPTILTLNYFSCAGICTPLLNGVLDAVGKVGLEPDRDFRVVTVSFDPRDTPEIAKTKRENYLKQLKRPFPPAAWRFLTGEAGATRRVADSVGFGYRAEGRDYIHPGAIMLLSPEGKVTRYMYGVDFLPSDLEMALREAARGEARPTISKLLRFCFSYDPEGKRYVFSMTRVVGALTLLLLGGFAVFVLFRGKATKSTTERSPS